jgi:putative RNA 2'-phosphotransferase
MAGVRTGSRPDPSQRLSRLSRLVALVLRHRPEEVGVSLDAGGFTDLESLAAGLATQPGWESISGKDLIALAQADSRRYELQDGRIRARYGHTISIERPGEPAYPPEWLYVGVDPSTLTSVAAEGLRPVGRQYLHLSVAPSVALDVGRRHARDAVVVVVFARKAADAGLEFRRAGPALYLTAVVPPAFVLLPI